MKICSPSIWGPRRLAISKKNIDMRKSISREQQNNKKKEAIVTMKSFKHKTPIFIAILNEKSS